MTKDEALKIIKDENLKFFNWYSDHKIRPNEVGIQSEQNKWHVHTSDERANLLSKKIFQTENEALENFIKRLRALNKYNKL